MVISLDENVKRFSRPEKTVGLPRKLLVLQWQECSRGDIEALVGQMIERLLQPVFPKRCVTCKFHSTKLFTSVAFKMGGRYTVLGMRIDVFLE